MKKILNIYLAALGFFIFGTSCSDFLDQEPPMYANEEEIWSSPSRIENTLLGLYSTIKNFTLNDGVSKSLLGGKGYLVFDNRGDDLTNVGNNLVTLYDTYNYRVGATYAENEDFWMASYLAINRTNIFLEGLETAKDILEPEVYNQYKAEACFVRAICYYYLNNLYAQKPYIVDNNAKSVPLRLQAERGMGNNDLAASTVKQVYEQVLKDLDDSLISLLPNTKNTYNAATRATRGAANMLKMRVYMAMGEWAEAIKYGNFVKESGYALSVDVTSLYKAPFYSNETIFSLPMHSSNRPNTQQGLAEYYNNGRILLVDKTNGVMSKENYSLANDDRVRSFVDASNNKLLKYVDAAEKLEWVPIMRYAETLLSLAECHANLGGAENETLAKGYLKEVRSRSIIENDPLNIDAMTGSALMEAIENERRLEFIGEGMRGLDLFRKGQPFVRGTRQINPGDVGYSWPYPLSETQANSAL